MKRLFLFQQAKTKGMETNVDIGVKYADKQQRHFDDEKMKAGQCVIGLQVIDTFPGTALMFLHVYHCF